MRPFLSVPVILLSIATSSLAAKCDASTAQIIDMTEMLNRGDFAGSEIIEPSDPIDTTSPFAGTSPSLNEFSKRQGASLDCVGDELCVSIEGSLWCVDSRSGDYRNESGATGNTLTGTYTGPPSGNSGSSGTSTGINPESTRSNTGTSTGSGTGSGPGSGSRSTSTSGDDEPGSGTSGGSGSTVSQPSAEENVPGAGSALEVSMAKAIGVTLLAGLLQRALLH